MNMLNLARQLGIDACVELDARLLVPEWRIRELCVQNKCGNYGSNYMCPPHIGSLKEIKARLEKFHRAVLIQYSQPADTKNDIAGVTRIKLDLHNKILTLEDQFRSQGIKEVWGLIGGSCALCEVCKARDASPCSYPDRARTSLESLGVDVVALLDRSGLDSQFHPDKVTWTGCVLY